MNYYTYDGHKIYICILTMLDTHDWRKKIVNENIKKNPKINKIVGINGSDIQLVKNLVVNNNLKLDREKFLLSKWSYCTYGKLGRWLSSILTAKLSMDTNTNIILIEDDLELPKNFNFCFEKWFKLSKHIIRLGSWGDGYFFNPKSSRKFLTNVYERGIIGNNDHFMMCFTPNRHYSIISREKYGSPLSKANHPKYSSIKKRSREIDFKHEVSKPEILLNNRFVESIDDFNGHLDSICNNTKDDSIDTLYSDLSDTKDNSIENINLDLIDNKDDLSDTINSDISDTKDNLIETLTSVPIIIEDKIV